jgi:hypothetical protein
LGAWLIAGLRRRGATRADLRRREERPWALWKRPPALDWDLEHSMLAPFVWFVFVFALSSAMATKREVYAFCFMPPMALLAAVVLVRLWRGRFGLGFERAFSLVAIALLVGWRSKSGMERVTAWIRYEASFGEKVWPIARELAPIILGALLVFVALLVAARFIPSARRALSAGVLCLFLYAGFLQGAAYNFQRKSTREYDWSVVSEAVNRHDYHSLVFLGGTHEPDACYYLDGINMDWRRGIGFQQIVYWNEEIDTPLAPDPGCLVILQKCKDPFEVRWSTRYADRLARLLTGYRRQAQGRDFDIYRAVPDASGP